MLYQFIFNKIMVILTPIVVILCSNFLDKNLGWDLKTKILKLRLKNVISNKIKNEKCNEKNNIKYFLHPNLYVIVDR